MDQNETVAVVGLGYVGLPLALLADSKGYRVIGVDTDEAKIAKLRGGQAPFVDASVSEQLAVSQIEFTSDLEQLKTVRNIIICVPTPVDDHQHPDLTPVRNAAATIARELQPGQLVVLESTVNPGITESVVLTELEEGSGLKGGRDFHLAHCPERINPGDIHWDVTNIPRVIGSLDEVGLERAVTFYRSIVSGEIRPMNSIREAEAVKVVENSFRDINIAFVNELAMSFDKLGIDVVNVLNGAATKPFAFMAHFPGCGVGGHCIPVDPYYLIEYARENGFDHEFLSLARRINRKMPRYTAEMTAELLQQAGCGINGARVAVLGLAYKADIDDTRESPAYEIIEALEELGAVAAPYDPYVTPKGAPKLAVSLGAAVVKQPQEKMFYETVGPAPQPLIDALAGADAVVIATSHKLFRQVDPAVFRDAGVKVIVDGRNCLDKRKIESLGLRYKGIGR